MEKILIPRQNLEKLKKKFQRAVKKAEKLGLEAPELLVFKNEIVIKKVEVPFYDHTEEMDVVFVPVTYSGEFPIIKGWNLAAVVEHSRVDVEKNGNKVRVLPNYEEKIDRVKLVDIPSVCEHCNTKRFRKNTYTLHNPDTDEYRQVGSTCIKDFLGENDPSYIVNSAKYIEYIEEMIGGFGGIGVEFKPEYKVEDVLTITDAVIDELGWVSRSVVRDSGEIDTATQVSRIIVDNELNHYHPDLYVISKNITDKNKEFAKEVIDWVKSLDMNDPKLNEYLFNCAVCVNREYIEEKEFGLVCSLISTYRKKLEKDREVNDEKKSEWFGEVKERVKDIPVTFLNEWGFSSSYGYVSFFKFVTCKGNIVIWKTSSAGGFNKGEQLLLTGTIKEHNEYNGTKQTVMTRCKIK